MAFQPHLLVDQETGERDLSMFKVRIAALLLRDNYTIRTAPPCAIRSARREVEGDYLIFRGRWLRERGMADDQPMSPMPQDMADQLQQWGTN